MTDESEERKAAREAETAVSNRVIEVVKDLDGGKVGTSDRRSLGDALQRATRNSHVGRAIGGIGSERF